MKRTRTIATAVIAGVLLSRPAGAQPPEPAFPITLQQAVRYATEHYPSVRAALARVAAHESGVNLAETAYLPRLDWTLQVNRATRNNVAGLLLPGTLTPSISGPASDTSSWSGLWGTANTFLLSWEAFDFGLRGASVNVARALAARATAGAELTRLEVALGTADAFLRLAAAQETVRSARANLERQQVFAETVGVLVNNQLRPGADNSRAQAELALARIQLVQAEQAERIARASLAQWFGVSPVSVQILTEPLLTTVPAPAAASTASLATHPLAETQMATIESSRAQQDVLGHTYYPRFNLQSTYALRDSGAAANGSLLGGSAGLGFNTPNWAVGVTATFPLFDWFSLKERRQVEAHNERAEVATYDRIVRQLTTQSEQARAEMDGARRIAENTPIQLASARVLEQQSRARYGAGLATIVEVADAQRLLLQAEVGDIVARLGIWRALLAEASASGDISELLK
jgi:outer membrane protein TolC